MSLKSDLSILLSFALIPLPTYANPEVNATSVKSPAIFSTMDSLNSSDRENLEKEIFEIIDQNNLESQLLANGLSKSEISARMASLSQVELANLKMEVQEARAGGILVAILLVVLIIYFAQRI